MAIPSKDDGTNTSCATTATKHISNPEEPNICLIGGTGRSGTSILRKVFSEHPNIARVPEWRGGIDPDGILDFYITFSAAWSPHFVDAKIRRLESQLKSVGRANIIAKGMTFFLHKIGMKPIPVSPYKISPRYVNIELSRFAPNYFKLVDGLIDQLTDFRFYGQWTGSSLGEKASQYYASPYERNSLKKILGDFYRAVVSDILTAQNVKHYIEDNTWNFLWFNFFRELHSGAKLVHIHRDPRDVVASFTKQRWAPNEPVQAAIYFRDLITRWKTVRADLPKSSYLEIPLTELVSNTEEITQKICRFWNIEWHDSLLKTDLSFSNTGRWKRDFDQDEQARIHEILGATILELGYHRV